MSPLDALAIFGAGVGAGTINTVVGSGSLITFPTLVALGYPPVVANVSNTVGIFPGSITGAFGYRRELTGQRDRLIRLSIASALGAVTGGLLLLKLPAEAFHFIVPILIGIALLLVVGGPWLNGRMKQRRGRLREGPLLLVCVYGSGVYGGYFGAAQGVILIGLLGLFLDESLQRINAAKNVAAAVVNLVAAVLFMIVAEVAWSAVGVLVLGSIAGGLIGSSVGRRLSPLVLRGVVVVIGVLAIVELLK